MNPKDLQPQGIIYTIYTIYKPQSSNPICETHHFTLPSCLALHVADVIIQYPGGPGFGRLRFRVQGFAYLALQYPGILGIRVQIFVPSTRACACRVLGAGRLLRAVFWGGGEWGK